MIKELFKDGNNRYFEGEKEGKKVFFKVFEYVKDYTFEEIEKAFNESDLVDYVKERYSMSEILKESLNNLFSLQIYSFGQWLEPQNFNLYEYDKLIKGNQSPLNALKSACICKDREGEYFYIACEPYDASSALTKNNINIIHEYVNDHVKEFEDILKFNYSHTEIY